LLGVSGGLFLISADMAIFGLGWVEEQGGVTAVIGLLLAIFGSFVFPYGLLDKYVIHRGRPVQPARWVRVLMSTFVAGWILLPTVALLIPAVQVARYEAQQQESQSGNAAGVPFSTPTRVTDREGLHSIEVPSGWREDTDLLEQGYAIAVSNVVRDLHLTVLIEAKTDFVQPELRTYATLWGSQFPQLMENPEMTPWSDAEINRLPAVQCEARGVANGVRLAFLLTCIETDEHFCAVQAWTTRSQFDLNRAELERITGTFR
jgi:hypothetical protein